MSHPLRNHIIPRCFRTLRPTTKQIMWKPHIEIIRLLNLFHIFLIQPQAQRLNVAFQVLNLPAPTDWENIRGFMHDVRQRNTRRHRPLLLCNPLQNLPNLLRILRLHDRNIPPPIFPPQLLRLKISSPQGTPRSQRHALIHAHGYDISFEVAIGGAPEALVDGELAEAVFTGVGVAFDDDPGGGVGDAEVEDFAGGDDEVV